MASYAGGAGGGAGVGSRVAYTAGGGSGPIVSIDVGHTRVCAAVMLSPASNRTVTVSNFGLPDTFVQNSAAIRITSKSMSHPKYDDCEFGFDALQSLGLIEHGHLFTTFKMALHKSAGTSIDSLKVCARNNSKVKCKVITLMALLLQWAKNEVYDHIDNEVGLDTIDTSQIQWVVTVPAVWEGNAKAFMREAAYRAHLTDKLMSTRLMLALEPECAAVATILELPALLDNEAKVGRNIMIADCGGGTIDLSVLQIVRHNPLKIKQLTATSGGALGSTKIDQAFLDVLGEILGHTARRAFQDTPAEVELMSCFEALKVRFKGVKKARGRSKYRNKASVEQPIALAGILAAASLSPAHLQAGVNRYNTSHGLSGADALKVSSGVGSTLVMPASFVERLFMKIISQVCDAIKVAAAGIDLSLICCAGGFSQSDLLLNQIKALNIAPVQRPHCAVQSIARGGTYLACDKELVTERICRFTLGIEVNRKREDETHPSSHTFVSDDGITYDGEIFLPLVRKGDKLPLGHVVQKELSVCNASQTQLECKLYQSSSMEPKHIYDSGVVSLHTNVCVDVGSKSDKKSAKTATFKFQFGGTEAVAVLNGTLTHDTDQAEVTNVFGR